MVLLHISDIHFRRGEVGTTLDPNLHLRNELLRDAERMCSRLGAPEAILISGDIAFGGERDEYDFALAWLEQLCRSCNAPLSTVFVCPGNHDVVRSVAGRNVIQALHRDIKATSGLSSDGLLRGLLLDQEASRLLYEPIRPYNLFAVRFFCDLLPPDRTVAQRDLRLNDGSILRLWGLNSALVSSASDARGDLFLDPSYGQITRQDGVEHLVMSHHPYEWLREPRSLRDHLNDVARVHLFGHEHTNRIELGRDWVRVAASAAHPDRQEPGWEPGYNLVELNVRGDGMKRQLDLAIHVRVWQTAPGTFRPKMDREEDAFRHAVPLDSWKGRPEDQARSPAPPDVGQQRDGIETGGDPMSGLRDVSVRFFKLTLSQKSAIAGRLGLLEEEDTNEPDFVRFRRVFIRARDRHLLADLEREIMTAEQSQGTGTRS